MPRAADPRAPRHQQGPDGDAAGSAAVAERSYCSDPTKPQDLQVPDGVGRNADRCTFRMAQDRPPDQDDLRRLRAVQSARDRARVLAASPARHEWYAVAFPSSKLRSAIQKVPMAERR